MSLVPPATPAQAFWNQRQLLREAQDRLFALEQAVDDPRDLVPAQWAQLLAFSLEFRPTLVIELGRGLGNSTCVFTEAANRLPAGSCRVLSLCLTDLWAGQTVRRLKPVVPDGWFAPLSAVVANILTFDFESLVRADDRVFLFWDAHGFEVAECVLGRILPLVADKPHVVAMHDLSDARYLPPALNGYGGQRLWMGQSSTATGARVRLGHVHSEVAQSVAIVDFCSRNQLTLESADHSLRSELCCDAARWDELRETVGERHCAPEAHWFWFSLNEKPGPYTFPAWVEPRQVEPPQRWGLARRVWARLRA